MTSSAYVLRYMGKYTSKEVWNLRDSLCRAKARAADYYQRLRGLETKVRDLERSRNAWKKRYQQGIAEESKSEQTCNSNLSLS